MVPAKPERTSLTPRTVNQECRSDCPSDLSRFATRPSDQGSEGHPDDFAFGFTLAPAAELQDL